MSQPTPTRTTGKEGSLLSRHYALTTLGAVALVVFIAFEMLAVTTVMPTVARELDGVRFFALSFAAPLASGVVGMVATGWWSDRAGPARPLVAAIVLFTVGLVICGVATTMPTLVAGRLVQGLGGGGLTVGLYVVAGIVYPTELQPRLFAWLAAAWVLPALIGPSLAAGVAHVAGWRWVFLGMVGLVAGATLLIVPGIRGLPRPVHQGPQLGAARLVWAVVAAAAVLGLDLAGDATGGAAIAVALGVVAVLAMRPLVPRGTLAARPGLPSVVATRGLVSAGFFSAEAYLPFVLQEQWGWSPGPAGAVLAAAGVMWALGSAAQSRWSPRLGDTRAMELGALLLLSGTAVAWAAVAVTGPTSLLIVGYAVASAGMGVAYPRTEVAMLSASTDADRGFNSAAVSVADSLGAGLSLALCGLAFTVAQAHPFTAVYAIPLAWSALSVVVARRTPPPD